MFVEYLGFEPLFFAPTQVHPEQHLCKILRVGPAGTSLDRADRVISVRFARQQTLSLSQIDLFFEFVDQLVQFDRRIRVVRRKLEQHLGVRHAGLERGMSGKRLFDQAPPLNDTLRPGLVIPKPGL